MVTTVMGGVRGLTALVDMDNLPRISVITPSYNQGKYIEQTITSVLTQGYPDLEYIVMDGGSTDETVEILSRYGDRLKWVSEKDRGQSHAINKGMQMATGDVVAYLNSDDCYEPGALLRVGKFFAKHPEACWVTGQCRNVDTDGLEVRRAIKWYKNLLLFFHCYPLLKIADYIAQPATFWRHSVIDSVGLFDEHQPFVMDYDYSLRVGRRFKLWVIPKPLAKFRVHNNSKSWSSTSTIFAHELDVVSLHTESKWLLTLHALHSAVIIGVYWYMVNRYKSIPDQKSVSKSTHNIESEVEPSTNLESA